MNNSKLVDLCGVNVILKRNSFKSEQQKLTSFAPYQCEYRLHLILYHMLLLAIKQINTSVNYIVTRPMLDLILQKSFI